MALDEAQRKALISELSELMQAEGLTAARVRFFAPTATKLLNDVSPEYVVNEIANTLTSAEQNKYTVALTYAFGIRGQLGPDALLSNRRQNVRDLEQWDVSDDTLRRWERRGIELLIDRLFDRYTNSAKPSSDALEKVIELQANLEQMMKRTLELGPSAADEVRGVKDMIKSAALLRKRIEEAS